MSLPARAKETVAFTPDFCKNQDNPPIYHITVPNMLERSRFKRNIGLQGATGIAYDDVIEELKRGVKIVTEDECHVDLLEIIDDFSSAGFGQADKELQDKMNEIVSTISPIYEPYRVKVAEWEYYTEVMPTIAAQMFLRKWQNVEHKLKHNDAGVKLSCLDKIPPAHVWAIGFKAYSLMFINKEQAKNSESSSK